MQAAITRKHFRCQLPYIGVGIHKCRDRGYHPFIEPHIGIDDQVIGTPLFHRLAHGHIMGGAVTGVLRQMDIGHIGIRLAHPLQRIIGGIVANIHFADRIAQKARKAFLQLCDIGFVCYYR